MGETLRDAVKNAYSIVERISYEGKTFRKDIGKDLMT